MDGRKIKKHIFFKIGHHQHIYVTCTLGIRKVLAGTCAEKFLRRPARLLDVRVNLSKMTAMIDFGGETLKPGK
jgi:hypothetical protein